MKGSRAGLLFALPALLLTAGAAGAQTLAEQLAAGQYDKVRERSYPGVQGEANFNLMLGRPDINARLKGVPRGATNCVGGPERVQSANDWLAANAGSARVLMFNENHHVPAARVFVRGVLSQLRALGFTHMGFEAFRADAGVSKDLGPADGLYYSPEPTFAALMREARAQEFVLFAYESDAVAPAVATNHERMALREQTEAENLQRIVREAPAGSRFVIFAGWAHIRESPQPIGDGETLTWMATRFKEQSGIDPLTIDLTGCGFPVPAGSGEGGHVRIGEDGQVPVDGQFRGSVDAQFVLPTPAPDHPDLAGFYRGTLGKAVTIPKKLRPPGVSVVVEARKLDQPAADVAYDRVLLEPGDNLPVYLPPGQYELVSRRTDGILVGRSRVKAR